MHALSQKLARSTATIYATAPTELDNLDLNSTSLRPLIHVRLNLKTTIGSTALADSLLIEAMSAADKQIIMPRSVKTASKRVPNHQSASMPILASEQSNAVRAHRSKGVKTVVVIEPNSAASSILTTDEASASDETANSRLDAKAEAGYLPTKNRGHGKSAEQLGNVALGLKKDAHAITSTQKYRSTTLFAEDVADRGRSWNRRKRPPWRRVSYEVKPLTCNWEIHS